VKPMQASAPPTTAPRPSRRAAFLAGIVAACAALAAGELAGALVPGASSLVIAIGDLVIALQPPGAKELVVALFGTWDKLALEIGIALAAALIAGGLGVLGLRRPAAAAAGFLIAGAVGFLAALRQPLTEPVPALIVSLIAIVTGIAVLRLLLALVRPRTRPAEETAAAAMPDWERRRFLLASGGALAASAVAAGVGRSLLARPAVLPPSAPGLPPAVAEALPPGAALEVPGITPIVVPTADFYRIDTALISPRVDPATWILRIHGMVEREVTLTLDDLVAMPAFDQHVTIACVSNEVGGRLVGNARWTGVDLREVLAMAGVRPEATQLVGRSVDRWTAGFPTAWAMDPARRPMIALGMNGEPLPQDHGYPARLIIPGLYGYVSATKWLSEIELTTLEAFDGYWVPLGWAKEAPILTQARIDLPRRGETVPAGTVAIAGVAWAPDRGISAVEVRVDDGPWLPAVISEPISRATWVQWHLPWEAAQGEHTIAVRATDGEGVVQTDEQTPPAPDGARGHHEVRVSVA